MEASSVGSDEEDDADDDVETSGDAGGWCCMEAPFSGTVGGGREVTGEGGGGAGEEDGEGEGEGEGRDEGDSEGERVGVGWCNIHLLACRIVTMGSANNDEDDDEEDDSGDAVFPACKENLAMVSSVAQRLNRSSSSISPLTSTPSKQRCNDCASPRMPTPHFRMRGEASR